MQNNVNSKGFTLIEVLVSLTIVGIIGSAIFVVLSQSLYTLDIMQRRLEVMQYGFERVTLELSNPKTAFVDEMELESGTLITFETTVNGTILPTLFVTKVSTKSPDATSQFYYYSYEK